MTVTQGSDFIKLTLSFHQRQVLRMVAERGGAIDFKFGASSVNAPNHTEEERAKLVRDSDNSIRAMETMGLTKQTPIIGYRDTVRISLTDIGRNVVDQMKLIVEAQTQTIKLKKD